MYLPTIILFLLTQLTYGDTIDCSRCPPGREDMSSEFKSACKECFVRNSPMEMFPPRQSQETSNLRVVSWNAAVFEVLPGAKIQDEEEHLESQLELIFSSQADVIALEEAPYKTKAFSRLLKKSEESGYNHCITRYINLNALLKLEKPYKSLIFFSRHQIIEHRKIEFSLQSMGRRALIVDIDYLPQRRLRFALYHASFGTKDRDMERRAEERHKLLTEARKGLQAHDFLAIIGDYNDNPEVVTQMFPFIDREKNLQNADGKSIPNLELTYSKSLNEYHTYWAKTRPDGFATNMAMYSVGGLQIIRGGMSDHYPIMEDYLLPLQLPDNSNPRNMLISTNNRVYPMSDDGDSDFSNEDTKTDEATETNENDDTFREYDVNEDNVPLDRSMDSSKARARTVTVLSIGGGAVLAATSVYAAYRALDRPSRRDST